jgi:hypothetical protein
MCGNILATLKLFGYSLVIYNFRHTSWYLTCNKYSNVGNALGNVVVLYNKTVF